MAREQQWTAARVQRASAVRDHRSEADAFTRSKEPPYHGESKEDGQHQRGADYRLFPGIAAQKCALVMKSILKSQYFDRDTIEHKTQDFQRCLRVLPTALYSLKRSAQKFADATSCRLAISLGRRSHLWRFLGMIE